MCGVNACMGQVASQLGRCLYICLLPLHLTVQHKALTFVLNVCLLQKNNAHLCHWLQITRKQKRCVDANQRCQQWYFSLEMCCMSAACSSVNACECHAVKGVPHQT